jgi:deoxyxylulose-5-phosphate synthase
MYIKFILKIMDIEGIVLVRPKLPVNVGSIARVMAAFGVEELIIVSDKENFEKIVKKSRGIAKGGAHIIDNAKLVSSLSEVKGKKIGTISIYDNKKYGFKGRIMKPFKVDETLAEIVKVQDSRRTFVQTLNELSQNDPNILVIICDVGFNYLDDPNNKFRVLNLGVTEASSMIIAAALALSGFKPYVYSMINFVTFRAEISFLISFNISSFAHIDNSSIFFSSLK